jgi:phosphate transport system substrate-binding protein
MRLNFLKAGCLAVATLSLSMVPPKPFFMDDTELTGAGSSFDYPLFTKMFADYNTTNGIKVNYQSVGSGAGISQLTAKTVDFGATDAPMNGEQDSALPAPACHIPVTAGAVVLSYNLA